MFETQLAATFKRIFELKKVTYDSPGENQEQECLFIEIESAVNQVKTGPAGDRSRSKVTGNCVLYANNEKMPFGFFDKKIQQADPADTKDLFFFDIEVNTRRYRNIVQRGFSFVYFFDSQYDPETGTITSLDFEFTEET